MAVILPVPVGGTATGWQLVDYSAGLTATSGPAVAGICTVEFRQLDPNELWLLDHAVVSCTSTTQTQVRLYLGAADPLHLLDGSDAANFDVAEWSPELQVLPSTSLLAIWTGASAGAVATIALQARVLRRL